MKKSLKLFTLVFALMFAVVVKVNASDLSSKLTVDDGLGGLSTYETYYNAEEDITEVNVRLTLNDTVIDTVLDQHPGHAGEGSNAKLGWFYITLDPGLAAPLYKQNQSFESFDDSTIEEIKDTLRGKITEKDKSIWDEVWPIGLIIRYKDADGKWVISNTPGDGVTTIRQDLANKLGVYSSELKYGENYRFEMYENQTFYYIWSDVNPNSASNTIAKEEFIAMDFEIAFPIQTTNEEESVYHLTLEDAVKNGYDYIAINEDITVDKDVIIPKDKIVVIAEGATVTLKDAEITTKGGYIINQGTVVSGETKYYNVLVSLKDGDDYISDAYLVAEGEKVSIPTKEGYKLIDVKVYTADDEEITVTDGSFVMPAEAVAIEGTLEKITEKTPIKEEKNPDTGDNVMLFIILGIFGLVGTAIATNKLRKNA
ncbi:MAG: hypothetical protein IJY25_04175 [Bacilli bacterium]|nr:hypothetical protein [Bacilli bacterium]